MAKEFRVFESGVFRVRALLIDGKPYFAARDVKAMLGYPGNLARTLQRNCKEVMKISALNARGRESDMLVIPENDVVALIQQSSFASATEFGKWIADEVLSAMGVVKKPAEKPETKKPDVRRAASAKGSRLLPFEHPNFGKVRVLLQEGRPWLLAKDICRFLALDSVVERTALAALDVEERLIVTQAGLGTAEMVSEQGVYSLIPYAKRRNGQELQRWVSEEILLNVRDEVEKTEQPPDAPMSNAARRVWAAQAKAQLAAISELAKSASRWDTPEAMDGIGSALVTAATNFLAHVQSMAGGVRHGA